ncbi:MAG: prephenate dehydrogenase [Isosphaeraceae bacterium]
MNRPGTVVIVGVGLIGGSIGLALRARGLARRVIGVGHRPASLQEAARIGAIDDLTMDLPRAVAEADIAVICTPVSRIADDILSAARHGPDGILVTDAGSTKRRIVEAAEADPRGLAAFVAAHPIAGSEKKGAGHARADLCDGRACVLTPTPRTPPDRLERARSFWASIGCRIEEMGPDEHDRALALTSHLPHVVAASMAGCVPADLLHLAAGAYRDVTRVVGSDADLWTAIFRDNRRPLLDSLDSLQQQLDRFRDALERDDAGALHAWWQAAKLRRSGYAEPVSVPAPLDP